MKGRASAKTKRCGFKKGEERREGGREEKERQKKKRKKREKERKEKKSSLVYTSVARLLSFATCRGGTSSDQRAKEGERGGRFRSRRPSRFTEIQNNGSVPFRQSPVTRSSRDRIAGGGNFLASTLGGGEGVEKFVDGGTTTTSRGVRKRIHVTIRQDGACSSYEGYEEATPFVRPERGCIGVECISLTAARKIIIK